MSYDTAYKKPSMFQRLLQGLCLVDEGHRRRARESQMYMTQSYKQKRKQRQSSNMNAYDFNNVSSQSLVQHHHQQQQQQAEYIPDYYEPETT